MKSAAEIEYVRRAAAILDVAMEACRDSIADGRTERTVSGDVHHTLLASGSDIPSSPMNFLTGPRTAFAHGEPTDRVLRAGDFMHIQFGAHYRRYCCTIGRQLCLGAPAVARTGTSTASQLSIDLPAPRARARASARLAIAVS